MVKISVVTPVFRPDHAALRACARSVRTQSHPDWEWSLYDDGSGDGPLTALLEEFANDDRVTVSRGSTNQGISAATNGAIADCSGEWVAFLDQDDELHPLALKLIAQAIDQHPDADVIYTDEDKLDRAGQRFGAFRKPEWSPERLRHQNYLSHLTVIRRSLIDEIGGLRSDFDGSQDYDLVLRATERARRVVHIPRVLYHWRMSPTSTAEDPSAKPAAHRAAVRAVQEHCTRVGVDATVDLMPNMYLDVRRNLTWAPKVSIVIPSRGSQGRIGESQVVLVENCVESILTSSSYAEIEVVVVLDVDAPSAVRERLASRDPARITVLDYDLPFNFSDKINRGVVASTGDVVVALNDDTQVISPDWIEQLLVHLTDPGVGMVGPLLLLEDGRIQSAGHFYDDGAHHVAAGVMSNEPGPFGVLTFPSERSGLTFACVAMRRAVFEDAGGLSVDFPKAFNDVDFGNKLMMNGYRIIWTPKSRLYHFESLTRDPRVEEFEVKRLYDRWGRLLSARDPFLPSFRRQLRGA